MGSMVMLTVGIVRHGWRVFGSSGEHSARLRQRVRYGDGGTIAGPAHAVRQAVGGGDEAPIVVRCTDLSRGRHLAAGKCRII